MSIEKMVAIGFVVAIVAPVGIFNLVNCAMELWRGEWISEEEV